jgi:citrate synthase
MLSQPGQKIGRPRQKYTGEINRDFTPLSKK